MSNRHRKICVTLNYIKHFLLLVFSVTGCVSVSDFAFLVSISRKITSSLIWSKISATTARIKKSNSTIKKKKKFGKIKT